MSGDWPAVRQVAGVLSAGSAAAADEAERIRATVAAATGAAWWSGPAARAAADLAGRRRAVVAEFAAVLGSVAAAVSRLADELTDATEQARRHRLAGFPAAALLAGEQAVAADWAAAGALTAAADRLDGLLPVDRTDRLAGLVDPAAARLLGVAGLLDRADAPWSAVVADLSGLAAAGDVAGIQAYVASLSARQRDRLVAEQPGLVGGTDGMPPPLRYAANAVLVARARDAAWRAGDAARAGWLDRLIGEPPRQLLLFDPTGDGLIAEVFGDLAAAAHVAVLVPGITNTLASYARDPRGLAAAARNLHGQANRAGRGPVATVAWLGYDTPGYRDAPTAAAARRAAPSLVRALAGLDLRPGTTATVVAHSYGSLVAGQALGRGLAVDNVVVLGSPGVGARRAADLAPPADPGRPAGVRLFAARAPGDPVAWSQTFGPDPTDPRFGAVRLATGSPGEPGPRGHSAYLSGTTECTRNIVRVVTGDYRAVTALPAGPAERAGTAWSDGPPGTRPPEWGPEPVRRLTRLGRRAGDPDLWRDVAADLRP